MSTVAFENGMIRIHGERLQIISGAVHFFRIPRACWRDRLEKIVRMGCNCVESYIFWNLTEPEENRFEFGGNNDFEAFFRLAAELGLFVIARPGPYTCSECDNGGLPYWLMTRPDMEVRRTNRPFLNAVRAYWGELIPRLAALQIDNGGPVIAVQIENEYGGYCHDRNYLESLAEMAREFGLTVPFFTSDGDGVRYIRSGMVDGAAMTMNFGTRSALTLSEGRTIRPGDPPFCGEFWGSWFDHWGDPRHVVRDPAEYASECDDILRGGGNVNIYMACGGTNFGFMGGANRMPGEAYKPDTASYDFDAPVSECGDITPKFHALQAVIRKYRPEVKPGGPENPEKAAYGKIAFSASAPLFAHLRELSTVQKTVSPLPMEKLGQGFGFMLYRTRIEGPHRNPVALEEVRDRAQLFLNGEPVGIFYRNDRTFTTPELDFPDRESVLDILVENLGRINYGPFVGRDFKGISGSVLVGKQSRVNFEQYALPLDSIAALTFGAFEPLIRQPAFHRAELRIDGPPADTFLRFPGVHGCVFVNGFHLARYWEIGPSRTLYLPGCLLKRGRNEIVVFETTALRFPYVESVDRQDLGPEANFTSMIDEI